MSKIKIFIVLVILAAVSCAVKTKMIIKTTPTGADVKIVNQSGDLKDKVKSDVIYAIKNDADFFKPKQKSTEVYLIVFMNGYKEQLHIAKIKKGLLNNIEIIDLNPLDTKISFETDPPGCKIRFSKNNSKGWKFQEVLFLEKDFLDISDIVWDENVRKKLNNLIDSSKMTEVKFVITPFEGKYTSESANKYLKNIKYILIAKENYVSLFKDFDFRVGQSNNFSFKLNPFKVKLKVISDIEGVKVEDIREGTSFGYLGETPFIRNFAYQECIDRYDTFGRSQKVLLQLRATKRGYEDEYLDVEIQFGEEKTINIPIKKRPMEITFQSDPPGSHVYVLRIKNRKMLGKEKEKKIVKEVSLEHWKHLGTTPFTYFMELSDPLEHGDVLKFSRSGFHDAIENFKSGVTSYHKVLEPKGEIKHDIEVK